MPKKGRRLVVATDSEETTHGGELDELFSDFEAPQIPGYREFDIIGEGGMGSVYSALRESDGLKVAIKVIRSDVDGDTNSVFSRRFRREIEVSKHFAHPYLVKIVDGGTLEDSSPFLVMEYLEGQSLDERTSVSPLSITEFTRMTQHLCEAMSAYSDGGLVHRDIKPSNIFLEESGRTVLLDFGLVLASDLTALTETGDRLGTFCAMAPEQLFGKQVDIRADIYGLGVSLYVAVTQQKPRSYEDTVRLAMGKDLPNPKAPHELRSNFPKELSAMIMRCLELKAEDRYQTIKELEKALYAYISRHEKTAEDDAITLVEAPIMDEQQPSSALGQRTEASKETKVQQIHWLPLLLIGISMALFIGVCLHSREEVKIVETPQAQAEDVSILRDALLSAGKVPTKDECKTLGVLLERVGVANRLKSQKETPEEALALIYLARTAKQKANHNDLANELFCAFLQRFPSIVFHEDNEQLREELIKAACAKEGSQSAKLMLGTAKRVLSQLEKAEADYCRHFVASIIYEQFTEQNGLDSDIPPTKELIEAKELLAPLFSDDGRWLIRQDKALLYLKILERFPSEEGKASSERILKRLMRAADNTVSAPDEVVLLYLQTALNMLRRPAVGQKPSASHRAKAVALLREGRKWEASPRKLFFINKLLADNLIRLDKLKEASLVIDGIKLTGVPKADHWSLYELKAEYAEASGQEGEAIEFMKAAMNATKDERIRLRMQKKRDRLRLRYYSAGGGGS